MAYILLQMILSYRVLSMKLHVKTSTFGEVVATTQVAERVGFSFVKTQLFKNGIDSILQVDYSLNDPAG